MTDTQREDKPREQSAAQDAKPRARSERAILLDRIFDNLRKCQYLDADHREPVLLSIRDDAGALAALAPRSSCAQPDLLPGLRKAYGIWVTCRDDREFKNKLHAAIEAAPVPECATPISPAPSEEMRELARQAAKNRFQEPPIAGQVAFIMGPDGAPPAAPAEGPTPDAVTGFAAFNARIVPAFKFGGSDFRESAYTQAQLIDAYCQGRHDAAARSSSAPRVDAMLEAAAYCNDCAEASYRCGAEALAAAQKVMANELKARAAVSASAESNSQEKT